MTELVVLVISMWGQQVSGEWVYMGNQYVHQETMTVQECRDLINPPKWVKFQQNPYYKIELACFAAGEPK